jgi:hypothetical protein
MSDDLAAGTALTPLNSHADVQTQAGTQVSRPNRARATALLGRAEPVAPIGDIAGSIMATLSATVAAAVPYAGPSGVLDTELDVEHVAADGSQTRARVKIRFHR